MVSLFMSFPFTISGYDIQNIRRKNCSLPSARPRSAGWRGGEIGVRFNSNEPRNCFTQSAIICLKILPRIRERLAV